VNYFLYYTAHITKLKENQTDVVTVCLFRIFTFKQIILNPAITVAKHLVVLQFSPKKTQLISTNNCSGRCTEIVKKKQMV